MVAHSTAGAASISSYRIGIIVPVLMDVAVVVSSVGGVVLLIDRGVVGVGVVLVVSSCL